MARGRNRQPSPRFREQPRDLSGLRTRRTDPQSSIGRSPFFVGASSEAEEHSRKERTRPSKAKSQAFRIFISSRIFRRGSGAGTRTYSAFDAGTLEAMCRLLQAREIEISPWARQKTSPRVRLPIEVVVNEADDQEVHCGGEDFAEIFLTRLVGYLKTNVKAALLQKNSCLHRAELAAELGYSCGRHVPQYRQFATFSYRHSGV